MNKKNTIIKQRYHFLGIGGIGMSALAHILHEKGEEISGSDPKGAPYLFDKKMVCTHKLSRKNTTIVYSSAIVQDHPELVFARERGFFLMHRSDLLRDLLQDKFALLVTGTHGKTTTSALLSWVLQFAGLRPTYAIGGVMRNFNKNGGFGSGPYFVAEADESDGSFLNYFGNGAIITNVEKEHLEYWGTEAKLVEGFTKFVHQVKNSNFLFWCGDDPILERLNPPGISYGRKGAFCMKMWKQEGMKGIFTATFNGKIYKHVELPLIGEENGLNGLAVFGMALQLGIDEQEIRKAFLAYKGVKRRLEKVGELNRIVLYDDYAHHPTEIRSALLALKRAYGDRRLVVVFQPHRYTRIKTLDFSDAFSVADLAIITDIYSAGEKPLKGLNGSAFSKSLKADNTIYLSKANLLSLLPKILISGDVVMTAGAGDIFEVGVQLMKVL